MPIISRKRRVPQNDEMEEEDSSGSDEQVQTQLSHRSGRRRNQPQSPESDNYEADPTVGGLGEDGKYGEEEADSGQVEQLARKLVRLVLSCDYSRQPVRRTEILAKVLGPHRRQFKAVFSEAQLMLKMTFGMELVELPMKDKVTVQQRRAAQNPDKGANSSSNAWVLTSTLPAKYRTPAILPPARIPTVDQESAYVGLYTFIIATIYLSGGQLPEARLDRFLRRTNADETTPVDRTDKLLQRMIKDQYIVKVKDSSSGEEIVDYIVGPRGKVEVGEEGVAQFVKRVYGDEVSEDLDRRLDRSLGLGPQQQRRAEASRPNEADTGESSRRAVGAVSRGRRGRRVEDDQDDQDDDDDDDDDDDQDD